MVHYRLAPAWPRSRLLVTPWRALGFRKVNEVLNARIIQSEDGGDDPVVVGQLGPAQEDLTRCPLRILACRKTHCPTVLYFLEFM